MSVWTVIGIIILLFIIIFFLGVIYVVVKIGDFASSIFVAPKDSYVIAPVGGLTCPAGYEQPDGVGGLCYPSCNSGYHPFGCCVCSPDCPSGWADTGTGCTKPNCSGSCPSGFTDIGCFCQKPASYGRGAGTVPTACPAGHTKSGALCYPNCNDGYSNVAGVCWQD